MNPYYQDSWVKIFLGDCREVLPALGVKVDLVITSPPFNQSWNGKHHTGSQWEKHYEDDLPEDIYQGQQLEILGMVRRVTNDTGSLWYQLDNVISKHDDWHITPEGASGDFKRAFPEELVNNIISCFPATDVILDPYLGSGTTCYCAKKLNRYSIGIEVNERYAEMAAKRCSQEVMNLSGGNG